MTMPLHYAFAAHDMTPGAGFSLENYLATAFLAYGVNQMNSAFRPLGDGTDYGYADLDISASALNQGYLSFGFNASGNTIGNDGKVIELIGPTTSLLRLTMDANENTQFEYWDGSAWQSIGSTFTTYGYHKIDIHWNIAASDGQFSIYVDQVLIGSFTGDTDITGDTTIDTIRLWARRVENNATYGYFVYQALMVADFDLRTYRVSETITNALGTFNDLDDTPNEGYFDEEFGSVDFQYASTASSAGQGLTFAMRSEPGAYAGYNVEGVLTCATVKAQADPALFVRGALRKSSTNYESTGTQVQSSDGWVQVFGEFENDPATASAWADIAAVESFEAGFTLASSA